MSHSEKTLSRREFVVRSSLIGTGLLAALPDVFAARKDKPGEAPAAPALAGVGDVSGKPDILIIFTDQFSVRETPLWKSPLRTPHLDAIAAQGMRFQHAYSNSPVCMPARVCVLTGQFPHNTGLWGNTMNFAPLVSQAKLFADVKAAGYTTAQIGKLHWTAGDAFKTQQPYATLEDFWKALGLDHVEDIASPFSTPGDKGAFGQYLRGIGKFDAVAADLGGRLKGDNYLVRPSALTKDEHNEAFVANRCVEYIRSQPKDKPLFLVASFFGPHNPMDAPEPYASMYDPASLAVPPNVKFPYKYEGYTFDEAKWRAVRANYLGKISFIDDCAGRVIDAMKTRGKWDNTYVLFMADHGEMLGAHGRMTKGRFYEESAGVPLWIRPPRGTKLAGATSDIPVNLSDVYATVVDAAGGTMTPQRFCRSLLPIVRGEDTSAAKPVFSEIKQKVGLGYMVRKGPWKWFAESGTEDHLYNLDDDPWELNNLADDPAHAKTMADLKNDLRKWMMVTQIDYSAGYKPMAVRAREAKAAQAAKGVE